MTIWAAIKALWTARKALAKADKTTDAHRDKLKAKIIARAHAPDCALVLNGRHACSCGAARMAVLLIVAVLVAGCASTSVRTVREQGGQPTCWERAQLNVCDGVSWWNGVIPFGGGQD